MTNAITQYDDSDPYSDYAKSQQSSFIIGKLLKFTKGDYAYGENNVPVPMGTRFVMNMDSLVVGWVRWENNRPSEQIMGRVQDRFTVPRRNELGDDDNELWELDADGRPRDPWQRGAYVLLKIEQGAPVSEDRLPADPLFGIFTFAASSVGGLGAVNDVCKVYGEIRRQRPDEFPVIQIGMDSYQHRNRSFGRIKKPVFEVCDWAPKSVFPASLLGNAAHARQVEATSAAKATAAVTGKAQPELIVPSNGGPRPMTAQEAEKRTIKPPAEKAPEKVRAKPRF